jgi:hypothetical protein
MEPTLLDEALRIATAAEAAGITLRLAGSLAIHRCAAASVPLVAQLGREPPGDIDFIATSEDWERVDALLTGEGYTSDAELDRAREWGIARLIYTKPGVKIDVFFDRVEMSHTIDYSGRLATSDFAVAPADLLLSKLQVHDLTEKDVIDLLVLLDGAELDLSRVLGVLGEDWGFWYTAAGNLDQAAAFVAAHPELDAERRHALAVRVQELREQLDDAPKSRRWRMRARVGTRVRWYEPVEQVKR